MTINLCDKCGDTLGNYKEHFQLNVGLASGIELCKTCAMPFVNLLVQQDFLGDELVEAGFVKRPAEKQETAIKTPGAIWTFAE